MSEHKHDNRAAFGGQQISECAFARAAAEPAVEIGFRHPWTPLPYWADAMDGPQARGLCVALSDLLEVELHAAGTGERLEELRARIEEFSAQTQLADDDAGAYTAIWGAALGADARASDARASGDVATEGAEARNAAQLRGALQHIKALRERVRELEAQPFRPATGAIDYDRVRREVEECKELSDWAIYVLPENLTYYTRQMQARRDVDAACAEHHLTAIGYLTPRGREVLAAIEACRVEPERPGVLKCSQCGKPTIFQVEGAPTCRDCANNVLHWCDECGVPFLDNFGGAESYACRVCGHTAYTCKACDGTGYTDGPGSPVCPECEGEGCVSGSASGDEPPADDASPDPEPRWSEPVVEMAWGRCDRICTALGYTMTLRSGDKYSVEVYHTGEGEEYDVAVYTDRLTGNDRSAQAGVRAAAEISGRYDAATDRVRLTGLEPQQ